MGKSFNISASIHNDLADVSFLLDTGATVSVLSKTLYDSIPREDRPRIQPLPNSVIRAGNGAAIKFYGVAKLCVTIDSMAISHEFWICDIPYSGILGTTFMDENKIFLDMSKAFDSFRHDMLLERILNLGASVHNS